MTEHERISDVATRRYVRAPLRFGRSAVAGTSSNSGAISVSPSPAATRATVLMLAFVRPDSIARYWPTSRFAASAT